MSDAEIITTEVLLKKLLAVSEERLKLEKESFADLHRELREIKVRLQRFNE